MVNGEEIRNHLVKPTDVVHSIDDPAYKQHDVQDLLW